MKNNLLILWIIYGFVFITAFDSILNFLIYFIYFAFLKLELSYDLVIYLLPILIVLFYYATTLLILKKIKSSNYSHDGIYLTKFSIKKFIFLAVFAIILNPLSNKIIGLMSEGRLRDVIAKQNLTVTEYLDLYGVITATQAITRWTILIFLIIIFWRKNKQYSELN